MNINSQIGVSTPRKESWDKVTGRVKYNGDIIPTGTLHGKILTSVYSHAEILSINTSKAEISSGVQGVVTSAQIPILTGPLIEDRPPLAKDKVRYFGEPIAIVVANTEEEAERAVRLIEVNYKPLPVINSINDAIKPDASLVHDSLGTYTCDADDIFPKAHTNIVDEINIRKGDMDIGFSESDIIFESTFKLPQSDHIAMETRNVKAEILPSGKVVIYTSTQAPSSVQKDLSKAFSIPESDIAVKVPLVGGGFGGKSNTFLEYLAFIASKAVNGKMVKISNTREQDIMSAPSKIEVEATLKIGATKDGMIKALRSRYYVNCGAYSDSGPRMARAIASECSGPYNIENIYCDSLAVYTNHPYVTAYRGFGHLSLTFCIERMLDKLAKKLDIDPLELRIRNGISPKDLSPTQAKIKPSNIGNLSKCIDRLKELIHWDEGSIVKMANGNIRAKGVSCFWKTSSSPIDASSAVILTLTSSGEINLNCSVVEIGPGTKTALAQILAEKMGMDVNKIHVKLEVDTETAPIHWKTVASMSVFMAGNAIINAAEDLMTQIRHIGSKVLDCSPADLDISNQRVYLKDNPNIFIDFKDIVHGYKDPLGFAFGKQIIGHGTYFMKDLTIMNKETGMGYVGVSWSVGAQAVEIEYDPLEFSYRLINAATVIDAGKVINPKSARSVIMGGMSMGLGLSTREEFIFDDDGMIENSSLRTYKVMRFGEQPEYIVDFIETPQGDGPFGARGMGEHGILGMPAAFANAISSATEEEFDYIPITPESIWKVKTGGKYDTF
ncbi:MAG: xanthine dehydrogenase family protein molybdopterin-binding subunit [Tissierella sp.]|nr:xanthine dehydrogenase family protein molybdopterin-binding subunit [Tissierella sp.]